MAKRKPLPSSSEDEGGRRLTRSESRGRQATRERKKKSDRSEDRGHKDRSERKTSRDDLKDSRGKTGKEKKEKDSAKPKENTLKEKGSARKPEKDVKRKGSPDGKADGAKSAKEKKASKEEKRAKVLRDAERAIAGAGQQGEKDSKDKRLEDDLKEKKAKKAKKTDLQYKDVTFAAGQAANRDARRPYGLELDGSLVVDMSDKGSEAAVAAGVQIGWRVCTVDGKPVPKEDEGVAAERLRAAELKASGGTAGVSVRFITDEMPLKQPKRVAVAAAAAGSLWKK
eukprot:TRINITY_DN73872_c0_g1_i1.p1 TRINITY_DN73872_c0_g1~~TRINITY_DN73872_c0_g1_i1.p1  ORF type:complete len:283 (-),score=63.89 TRINITY_DN73872_c0_g1_i1:185-1033(-)